MCITMGLSANNMHFEYLSPIRISRNSALPEPTDNTTANSHTHTYFILALRVCPLRSSGLVNRTISFTCRNVIVCYNINSHL